MATTEQKGTEVPLMTLKSKDEANENIKGDDMKVDENQPIPVEPPDGGWGWFVVIGTTTCFMLIGMMGPCFGIFYGDRLRELGSTPTLNAWLFNVQAFFYNFAGPWAAPLSLKFGHRPVAFVAAIASCSSFFISAFVTNSYQFLITFSLISGAGGGICINCCFQMNAKYFKYRLGLANGIMMAGGSLGLCLLPQMASSLQKTYPFTWATILGGTIMLQAIPATMLLQPVEWHMKKPDIHLKEASKAVISLESNESLLCKKQFKMPKKMVPSFNFAQQKNSRSVPRLASVPYNLEAQDIKNKITLSNPHSIRRVNTMSEAPFLSRTRKTSITRYRHNSVRGVGETELTPMNSKMSLFYLGGSTIMGSVLTLEHFQVEEEDKTSEGGTGPPKKASSQGIWKNITSIFNPSVLRDPLLITVALFTSITIPTIINILSSMPFVLSDAGYDLQSAATAMSVTATVDLITRLLCASITDKSWANPRMIYGGGQIVVIIILFVLTMGWTHWYLVLTLMAILGVGQGMIYALDVYLMARLLGSEKIALVFSLSQLIRSVAFLAIGPIVGTIRDVTGSYDCVFYFFLGSLALAFIVMLFTVYLTQRRERSGT